METCRREEEGRLISKSSVSPGGKGTGSVLSHGPCGTGVLLGHRLTWPWGVFLDVTLWSLEVSRSSRAGVGELGPHCPAADRFLCQRVGYSPRRDRGPALEKAPVSRDWKLRPVSCLSS